MQNIWKYIVSEKVNKIWGIKMGLSIMFFAIILIWEPFNLTFQQAVIVANTILVIIWWSTGIINKIPASLFLISDILYFQWSEYKNDTFIFSI